MHAEVCEGCVRTDLSSPSLLSEEILVPGHTEVQTQAATHRFLGHSVLGTVMLGTVMLSQHSTTQETVELLGEGKWHLRAGRWHSGP